MNESNESHPFTNNFKNIALFEGPFLNACLRARSEESGQEQTLFVQAIKIEFSKRYVSCNVIIKFSLTNLIYKHNQSIINITEQEKL